MEDTMPRISLSAVFVCSIIALQIELILGFKWKNTSRNIVACEHDDVQLRWGYELTPGEYLKSKTWFTGENKNAKRIAYWIDTDGFKIEPAYTDRVSVAGNENDSLILRRVTTSDEGIYTLIPNFPRSSDPNPRLSLNLSIYVSPLQEKGCCRPSINATNDELNAVLYSEQGCGKPLPIMNWNISRNKTVRNDTLILGGNDRAGMYKVCLIGPAIKRCFKGDEDNLCAIYTVQTDQPPQTIEIKAPLPDGLWIGIAFVILSAVIAVVIAIWFRRRFRKGRWATKELKGLGRNARESMKLIRNFLDVDFLTKELIHIYKEQTQFQKVDSELNLQTEICDGRSNTETDIDINIYRSVFKRREQPLKLILIKGEVGCGKSTWCNTLTVLWRKAHDSNNQENDPNNQESNDNVKFLQEYKLLFNISLSKVHTFANFKDLLVCLHSTVFDQLKNDIYDYIQKNKTIIIIQGLDKYNEDPSTVKNILSDNGLEHAVVIITGTPSMWNRYSKVTSVDRVIYVKGLQKDDMKTRAENILKDDFFSQAMIDRFFDSIMSNELEEFTTEPVFFPFLVEMWKMNCIFPRTRTDFLLTILDKQIKEIGISLVERVHDYRFSFEKSRVLQDKRFIVHCGKIVKFLGEIAVKILLDNKDGVTITKQEFDGILRKQNMRAEVSYQLIIDFCVSIKLVSIELNEEGDIHAISFRHKAMQTFLAAIYISTLNVEENNEISALIQSSKDLTQFINFLSQE